MSEQADGSVASSCSLIATIAAAGHVCCRTSLELDLVLVLAEREQERCVDGGKVGKVCRRGESCGRGKGNEKRKEKKREKKGRKKNVLARAAGAPQRTYGAAKGKREKGNRQTMEGGRREESASLLDGRTKPGQRVRPLAIEHIVGRGVPKNDAAVAVPGQRRDMLPRGWVLRRLQRERERGREAGLVALSPGAGACAARALWRKGPPSLASRACLAVDECARPYLGLCQLDGVKSRSRSIVKVVVVAVVVEDAGVLAAVLELVAGLQVLADACVARAVVVGGVRGRAWGWGEQDGVGSLRLPRPALRARSWAPCSSPGRRRPRSPSAVQLANMMWSLLPPKSVGHCAARTSRPVPLKVSLAGIHAGLKVNLHAEWPWPARGAGRREARQRGSV